MKTRFLYLLLTFLFALPGLEAKVNDSVDVVLKKLDAVIQQKDQYTLPKEAELTVLRSRLKHAKDVRQQYELCDKLFSSYLHYQADSALAYVEQKRELLPFLHEPLLEQELIINSAEVMGVMGMYSWAEELLSKVKPETLTPALLGYYY